MSETTPAPHARHHHIHRMGGRDPQEEHRVATPLELLFDLTFVTAIGVAASQFAHALAAGHYSVGLVGFGFASFAICWAWINFAWFASAYDTDDWLFRLVTMAQMIGVLILAIGVPRMFASVEHGAHLDMSAMVAGYVVMRVALVFQWLRAARQDPARRRACLSYVAAVSIAQIGWIALIFIDFPLGTTLIFTATLILMEMAGPVLAEKLAGGTPWHAHHIAERYSLFAIIALGEGVVGTVAALSAVIDAQGWTLDAALACIAGTGLTFGMWWIYYMLPSAAVLRVHRERSFTWGYLQIIPLAAIVATGAGLHVAAYFIEHQAKIGALATVLSVAIPVGIYLISIYALYGYLVRRFDPLHVWLLSGTTAVVSLAIGAAVWGVDMAWCLIILMFAPAVTVVGYELRGHRHQVQVLARQGIASAP